MLLKELKFLLSHSAIYGIGALITQVVGFIMLPVYTRYLTPSDYGILELITITNSVLGMVISVGVAFAILRFYYEEENLEYQNTVISTSTVLYILSSILASIILFSILQKISTLVIGSPDYAKYFKIAFASLLIGGFINIGDTYFRVKKRPGVYVLITTSRLVILLSLNIYFVVFAKAGVLGILYSTLISSSFFSVVIMGPILLKTGIRFSNKVAKEILKFSLPLLPADLLRMVINQSDRFFIRTLVSMSGTGIFSLALKLGNAILTLVGYPFNLSFMQRRFEISKRDDAEMIFRKVFTYFSLIMMFFGLCLSVFCKEIIYVMTTPAFFKAADLVPFIVLYCIIFSFRFHFDFGIMWSKKTYYSTYINMFTVVVNLVSNYLFIKNFGLFGAASAKCLTVTVNTGLNFIVGRKLYKIHYEFRKVLRAGVLAIAIYIASKYVITGFLILDLFLKVVLIISYPFWCYIADVITREEMYRMKTVISNFRPTFLISAVK